MIDHTGIAVSDWIKSKAFYDAAFAALGGVADDDGAEGIHRRQECRRLWPRAAGVLAARGRRARAGPPCRFTARSRAEVDAFYEAAMKAGGKDNGKPGIRAHYHPDYYGAFVFDPDGNNIEAVCHAPKA